MDITDRENLKEFLHSLYGSQVNTWGMSDGVFEVVLEMLKESSSCSDLMDLVPRPHALGKAPLKYLSKEARSIIIRKLKERKEYYSYCLTTVSRNYRTKVQMASMGAW